MKKKELNVLISREKRRIISTFYNESGRRRIRRNEQEWHLKHFRSHAKREAMLVLSGETCQSLAGRCFNGVSNDLFLYDHYERHDNGYSPSSSGTHLWIFCLSEVFVCNLTICRNGAFTFAKQFFFKDIKIIKRIEEVWDEASHAASPEPFLAELNALFNLIFAYCYQMFSNSGRKQKNEHKTTSKQDVIKMIKEYLKKNSGRDSDINSLARLAGYSPQHFQRIFLAATGRRVKEYIDILRLEKYEQIKDSCSVKVIATELGFSSSAAFAHWKKSKKLKGTS